MSRSKDMLYRATRASKATKWGSTIKGRRNTPLTPLDVKPHACLQRTVMSLKKRGHPWGGGF